MPEISVVIPVYNERENLPTLLETLATVLAQMGRPFEILCVDDGSHDGSDAVLNRLRETVRGLRVIRLRRHAGQTAALAAGFDHAQGRLLITMDADHQNDPRDVARLVALLEQGYDVVSGWRRHRQDPWHRRWPSQAANWLLAVSTGVPLHDSGCTLKAYRRQVLQHLIPYGDMHRILPAYLAALGCRIGELEVRHHPRRAGRSKYRWDRVGRVLLDIIAAAFCVRFSRAPIRAFGAIGLSLLTAGGLVAAWVIVRAVCLGGLWVSPLLFIAMFLGIAGTQFVALGLLGEMLLWTQATPPRQRTYGSVEVT